MFKKSIIAITNCLAVFLLAGCLSAAGVEKGYVKGTVKDSAGNPLQGVKIIVDHSIFYNSNITALTDASGNYRVKVPTGSWYAFAQLKKNYNGKTYSFYLKPDSSAGFGAEGAVRNFTWTLTGEKEEPLAPGFFGGTITFDNYPTGNYIEDENRIEFTLTPAGALIDGSKGEALTLRAKDAYRLTDVPIGRYTISASYRGKRLGLRKSGTEDKFADTLEIDFEPQIPARCDNCFQLEYYF